VYRQEERTLKAMLQNQKSWRCVTVIVLGLFIFTMKKECFLLKFLFFFMQNDDLYTSKTQFIMN